MKNEEELRQILANQYSRDELIIQMYKDIDKLKNIIKEMEKDIKNLKNYKDKNPPRLRI